MNNAKIAAALVNAQKGFAPALKTSVNPHFRSKYVDLAACVEAVIDSLNSNGIALMQPTHECETGVMVETLFIHESGEMLSGGKLHVPASKNDAQGYGSALTYARRYSLMAACGIAPEDDDGNAATANRDKAKAPVHSPRAGIGDDLPPDWKEFLQDLAGQVTNAVADNNVAWALAEIAKNQLDDSQYTYMANFLDAKTRAALKKK